MERSYAVVEPPKLEQAPPERIVSLRLFGAHVHRMALLCAAEALLVALSLWAAVFLNTHGPLSDMDSMPLQGSMWMKTLVFVAVVGLAIGSMGLYQLRHRARFAGVLARLVLALLLAGLALALSFAVTPSLVPEREYLLQSGVLAFAGLAVTRQLFMRVVDDEMFRRRVLVWGAGERAAAISRRLRRRTDRRCFRIVGYIASPHDARKVGEESVLPFDGNLLRLATRQRIEEIVVAMDDRRSVFPAQELMECRMQGIQVTDIAAFIERESGRVCLELTDSSGLIFSSSFRSNILRLTCKRAFDILGSALLMAISAPVALIAALAIYAEDRGPVLYRQTRVGQDGREFCLLKFRSMRVNAEADGRATWAGANDPRVTRVGRLIRRLRIDELPQLFNVLSGAMSLVGPRPERPEFVERLAASIPHYNERHFVKPGITGWAQVRFSYAASENDARHKLEFDLYYIKHHSVLFDLLVLLQTVEIVLLRIGAR